MPFLTDDERVHDHIGEAVDRAITFLQTAPDRASWSRANLSVNAAFDTVDGLLVRLGSNMTDGTLPPLPTGHVQVFLLALDTIFFNNAVFNEKVRGAVLWVGDDAFENRGKTEMLPAGAGFRMRLHTTANGNAWQMMETMLHEMLHLSVDQESGKTSVCAQEREACEKVDGKVRGKTGHGYQWQRLAQAVEARSVEVFGKRTDLRCLDSITFEWMEGGVIPSRDYLEELYAQRVDGRESLVTVEGWLLVVHWKLMGLL